MKPTDHAHGTWTTLSVWIIGFWVFLAVSLIVLFLVIGCAIPGIPKHHGIFSEPDNAVPVDPHPYSDANRNGD